MLSPAKALRYGSLSSSSLLHGSGDNSNQTSPNNSSGKASATSPSSSSKSLKRSLGNGYILDLTESIPHVVKDGHKLVRNCSTGKTVYWVCRKRKYGCPKYVHTDSAGTFVKKELGEHNHAPNQNPDLSDANKDQNTPLSNGKAEKKPPIESYQDAKSSSICNGFAANKFKRLRPSNVEAKKENESNIESANLVVSNVLAKTSESIISAIAQSLGNRFEESGNDSQGSAKKRKSGIYDMSTLLGIDGDDGLDDFDLGEDDDDNSDMVLDLSNAKTKAYHNSNHHLRNSHTSLSTYQGLNVSVNSSVPNVTYPHKNFKPIHHKFTKAVKAIVCSGRKFRRLDPATSEGLLSWRCQQKFCRYTLYTDEHVTEVLKSGGKHNHELDDCEKSPVSNDENFSSNNAADLSDLGSGAPSQVTVDSIISNTAAMNHIPTNVELAAQILKFSNTPSLSDIIQQSLLNYTALTNQMGLPEVTNLNLENIPGVQDLCKEIPRVTKEQQPTSPAGSSSTSRVILKRKLAPKVEPSPESLHSVLDFSQPQKETVHQSSADCNMQLRATEPAEIEEPELKISSESSVSPKIEAIADKVARGEVIPNKDAITASMASQDDSDSEPEEPMWNTVPTPLPEMPDSIRDEFVLINAPDGRNHVLQEGHIFSKDKCSSKSVYWRCKKKLCFAIMHTDLEMTTITFRRGEHNHEPDPKIEQRARKGHFAKMPRKPRRKKLLDGTLPPRVRSSRPSSNEVIEVDTFGKDSFIQSLTKTLNNNNNDEDSGRSMLMGSSLESTSLVDEITIPSSTAIVSPVAAGNHSVTDDILAILSEATSDIKDASTSAAGSSLSPDLRELLASNESTAAFLEDVAADPSSFLASVMASGNSQELGSDTSAYLRGLNKKMINNVLSKFL